jgi:nicotinamide-nucleotide amidase
MWFDRDDQVIVSLPGVPYEMKNLLSDEVIPRIIDKYNLNHIIHRTVMTIGVGESRIAELIHKWEMKLPKDIKLAYLPQPGLVRLRLSTVNENYNESIAELNHQIEMLHKIIPDIIFGYDDITIEEVVGNMLKESSSTISTAESCTGGYIAHLITRISGSSSYYRGSVISYSNDIKINQLNVSKNVIDSYGVVSREVIEQMASGGRNLLKTDYCIATSGIAGPKGGTKDKPVGTVWIAIASPNHVISKEYHLGKHRERNIRRSALIAMNMLRQELSVE